MRSIPSVVSVLLAAVLGVAVAAQEVRTAIGPLEQKATPSSPENPVPKRISAPQAMQPQELRATTGRGAARFQVTLDTSGRVAEIRRLTSPPLQFPPGTTVDEPTRRAMTDAMVTSAADALRQWRYDSPAAPITFIVMFTFTTGGEPIAFQQDVPPAPPNAAGPPPPWPAAADAVPVGGLVRPPQAIKTPKPRYTPEAMRARVEGTVMMEAVVGIDGKVRNARVLRSLPMLDDAALETLRQWEFTPGMREGKPVVVRIMVEMDFNLRDKAPTAQPTPGATTSPWPVAEPVAIQDPPPPLPARGAGPGGVATAPPWPAAEGAIRVGSTLRAPQQTKKVNPVYPRAANDQRVTGIVILEAVIGVDGKVKDARVLRSVPLLDRAVLNLGDELLRRAAAERKR